MSSPVMEQPSGFSLFGGSPGTDLRGVLSRLEQAREDENCRAVLLTFYNGGLMNMAQAQEIRRALGKLREAGKRTFIYADTYDTVSYLVASAATDVCLMDGGEVFMPGIMIEPMFYRGTLDKLGIVPDYVQVGEYKGAEEPYTRTGPSPELAGEMEQLAEAIHGEIVRQIARGRGLSKEKVAGLIDDAMIPAKKARMNGLVDHLVDVDGLRVLMSESLGEEEVRIDAAYGSSQEEFDADNPLAVFAVMSQARQQVSTSGPSIGLIYAEGVITGGEGGSDGLFAEGGIRRAMRMAERDENIKAIVIRIDSPGGSALASEAMYQAVRRVAETKPVIVSIGNMAASGGYYLACAGDTIIADPSAIVGSIGVVGGKLVLEGLYEKLGLSTATFSRGANADIYSSTEPWSDEQRELIRKWMTSTYELFTERVMESRGRKITDVDAVARGRIFLARDARKLGMVDRLGGIEEAITLAARRAELGEAYEVVTIPENQFNPFQQGGLPIPIGQVPDIQVNVKLSAEAAGLIQLLPAHLREALSRTVQLSGLLEDRPVVLMMPYLIRVR
jgi:protease-4